MDPNNAKAADGGACPPDPLASDWVTIWQSELAATASDREALEGMAIAATAWSGFAKTLQESMNAGTAGNENAAAPPGHAAPAGPAPGATPPVAAFGDGDAEIQRLRERVAELERQLAESAHPPVPSGRRRSRA